MSEVQGFHVNTAIQAIVRDQLDEINSQFVRQALSLSNGQLEAFKIYPDQQSFRRTIRTIGMLRRSNKSVDLVEMFPVLANAPMAVDAVWSVLTKKSSDAAQVSDELRDADIFDIEAWSHRGRNQLSFINAFTRLLMVKEPINANRADSFEYAQLLTLLEASQDLNSRAIPSQLELEKWFDDVEEAFVKFSVVDDDAPREYGQVRRRSQRIYQNAWKQFTKSELANVWARSIEIAKDPNNREFLKLRARNSASHWPAFTPSRNFSYSAVEPKTSIAQEFMVATTQQTLLTAELKAIDLPAMGAAKSFVSIADASSGLEAWLVSLQELFGSQKTDWSLVVSLQRQGTKSEVTISATTVRKLLPQALAALKILGDN